MRLGVNWCTGAERVLVSPRATSLPAFRSIDSAARGAPAALLRAFLRFASVAPHCTGGASWDSLRCPASRRWRFVRFPTLRVGRAWSRFGRPTLCLTVLRGIPYGVASVCVSLRGGAGAASGGRGVGLIVKHGRGHAVASRMFALVERCIRDFQHVIGNAPASGGHAIQAAKSETRGDGGLFAVHIERFVCDTGAYFACGIESLLVPGFGQHNRELFAADARHPIDATAQKLLQTGPRTASALGRRQRARAYRLPF